MIIVIGGGGGGSNSSSTTTISTTTTTTTTKHLLPELLELHLRGLRLGGRRLGGRRLGGRRLDSTIWYVMLQFNTSYVYVYIYIYIHNVYVYAYVYRYIHIYIYIHTYVYTYTYTHMYIYIYVLIVYYVILYCLNSLRPISLLRLSPLRFLDSKLPGDPVDMRIPPLKMTILLEPNPLKSRIVVRRLAVREMGGAPRNPAPRSHFLVWVVQPSGCHCTDGHLTGRAFTKDQQTS